ncbi:MAG: helix-turn-helix transcriptional regulator [Chloroflexi bacterium]|nr:helix-turn-helix transcriptional regulator [Chloroflexota bacterium]
MPPPATPLAALAAALASDPPDRGEVAKALGALLRTRGWSARALGRALGKHGSTASAWLRGDWLPPPWLALAIAAIDAGDERGEPLDREALELRLEAGGWAVAQLAAALGASQLMVRRWLRGHAPPPPELALALAEAERRTPRAARGAEAAQRPHEAGPDAVDSGDSGSAAAALNETMHARGWSARALERALGRGVDGSIVTSWRRGRRPAPPWLALALDALDAGDELGEALDHDALRERVETGGWSSVRLAEALGIPQIVLIRWLRGRSSPPPELALALTEAERRVPRSARRDVSPDAHAETARLAFAEALSTAHTLDRRLRAARYHGEPSAAIAAAAEHAAAARTAVAEALRALMDAAGWSARGLGLALGVDGRKTLTRWRRGEQLPPPWLALALAALAEGDEPGEPIDAAALRARMEAGGWSTQGLASALGVASAAVTRWRAGRTAPGSTVALALGFAERRTPRAARN